jgi:hypothetical protein
MDNLNLAKIYVEIYLNECIPKGISIKYRSTSHYQRLDFKNVPFRCQYCREIYHLNIKFQGISLKESAWRNMKRKKGYQLGNTSLSILLEKLQKGQTWVNPPCILVLFPLPFLFQITQLHGFGRSPSVLKNIKEIMAREAPIFESRVQPSRPLSPLSDSPYPHPRKSTLPLNKPLFPLHITIQTLMYPISLLTSTLPMWRSPLNSPPLITCHFIPF